MSKYNEKRVSNPEVQKTVTLQGGEGFSQKSEHELIGILATGLENTYYEKETEREKRFKDVIKKVASNNVEFAAKALVYARTVFGQRSVTHYGAVELIPFLSRTELGKRFFSKRERGQNKGGIIYRLDDMAEILACYQAKNGIDAPIPNAIKKGFKEAIEHSDKYILAKYQMKPRGVSLVDIVNLVHPVETEVNGTVDVSTEEYKKAIKGTKFEKDLLINSFLLNDVRISSLRALVLGLLKQFNTVEDKNTEAGKVVAEKVKAGTVTAEEAKIQLIEAKTENYAELIKTKKIGYISLLRNLRNILKTGDQNLLDNACALLVEQDFIRKSLIFPHQIDLCLEIMINEFSGKNLGKVANALNTAYELSIPNLSELFNEGRTAVVLDVSGSMSTFIKMSEHKNGSTSALDKGSLVAATLAKGIGVEMFVFANSCAKVTYNPLDSVHTLKNFINHGGHSGVGGGTYWGTIFPELSKYGKFERIFILSDEQGADQVETSYKTYCNQFGTPNVYVINMCGYAPTMIKQSTKVHRIYGYNADIYEAAKRCELDINAVINEINKIVI